MTQNEQKQFKSSQSNQEGDLNWPKAIQNDPKEAKKRTKLKQNNTKQTKMTQNPKRDKTT